MTPPDENTLHYAVRFEAIATNARPLPNEVFSQSKCNLVRNILNNGETWGGVEHPEEMTREALHGELTLLTLANCSAPFGAASSR